MDTNNYLNIRKNLALIAISLFFFLLITFIINFPHTIPLPFFERYLPYSLKGPHLDWTYIVGANKCTLQGYNVFIDNPCNPEGRVNVYGEILLHLPYVEKLNFFYYRVIPNIINYLFIFVILKIFNPKTLREILFIFVILISQPFILVLERTNLDSLVFLIFVLMAYYNNNLTYHISLLIVTLSKFYSLTLVSIFLFSGKLKNILLNILIFLTLLVVFLIFQLESLVEIFSNKSQMGTGLTQFNYSFYLMPKIFFYFFDNHMQEIKISKHLFYVIYCFIFFLILLWNFIYIKKKKIFYKFNFSNFDQRLFFIGLVFSVSCYFTLNNIIYREIFLIILLPYLINFSSKKNNSYLRNIKNLIYLKILIPSFLSLMKIFFYPENIFLKGINLVIKSSLDNFLLILLLSNLIYIMSHIVWKIFFQKNKFLKNLSYKL